MAEIVVDAFLDVQVTTGIASQLVADVRAAAGEDPANGEALFDVEVDGAGGAAAVSKKQAVNLEVNVQGIALRLEDLVGQVEVGRDLERNGQSFSFSVPLTTPAGPIGLPFPHAGPATCLREVDVYGVYKTPSGPRRVPLIRKGIGTSSRRRAGTGGFVEAFQGLDAFGRFDGKRVDLRVPPGSGLPRERVVQAAAEDAGVVDFALEPCGPTNADFTLAGAQWVGPVSELMDVELRKLLWNRDAELANPRFGPFSLHENVEPVRWSFTEVDLALEVEVELEESSEALTRVTLTSSAPILRQSCVLETPPPTRIERREIYTPAVPIFEQDSDGTYDTMTQPAPAEAEILVGLDVIEKQLLCGEVIFERTLQFGYYNPEGRRYEWNAATDAWKPIAGVFTNDDDPTSDNLAMQFPVERWLLLQVNERWHYFLQAGYRYSDRPRPFGTTTGDLSAQLARLDAPRGVGLDYSVAPSGQIVGRSAGLKLGTIERNWGWYAPRRYVQQRSLATLPLDQWNTVATEPADGLEVLGNKEAYAQNPSLPASYASMSYSPQTDPQLGETFTLLDIVVETPEATGENYLTAIDRTLFGWRARHGRAFLFGDGSERSEEEETFRIVGTEREIYVGSGDSSHDVLRSAYDLDGRPLPAENELGAEGYLPEAEFLAGSEVNESLYTDEDEQDELASLAHPTESQDLEVEIHAPELEECHEPTPYVGDYSLAETSDELERAARAMISESCAAKLTLALAKANFYISEGDRCHLVYHRLGVDHDFRVIRVGWSRSADGKGKPLLTKIEGRIYQW